MAIYPKVNGAYKEMTDCKVKVAGAWKQAKTLFTKVNGVWKEAWRKSRVLALNNVAYYYITPRNIGSTLSYATFKGVKLQLHDATTGQLLQTKDVGDVKIPYGNIDYTYLNIAVTSSSGCNIAFKFNSDTGKKINISANNYPVTTAYYCLFEYYDCVAN